jgi:hypothetical protein
LQLNFGETTRHPGWLKNYCLIMQIFGVITSEGNMKLIDCRKRTIAVLILLILYSRNTFSFYFFSLIANWTLRFRSVAVFAKASALMTIPAAIAGPAISANESPIC